MWQARLQAECPPGSICVSRSVRDHVHGRFDLVFEELGVLRLKNIARPVEAFLIRPDAGPEPQSVPTVGTDYPPLPDKPSIAVLAFTNMSGNPDQEYFSDGVADEIITELSHSRSLFVIARNSSFTYKGRAVHIKQVARELGVRYVLEGSVRRSGSRVRVIAQLIEAETGSHIWADRYDRALEDIFAVQDEITTAVVTAIQPVVADAELRRALRKPPGNLSAWEAYQRGLWHMEKYNATDAVKAQHLFERAIALDAGFASAHVALSRVFTFHTWVSCTLASDEGRRLIETHAREAVAIHPNDPEAQARLAWCWSELGKGKEALEGLSPVLARNPNSALANGVYGLTLVCLGHRLDGRAALLKAMRLNPRDRVFPSWITVSYYYDADYNRAVKMANTVIERYPDYPIMYKWLAAALGQLGRHDEARSRIEARY